MVGISAPVKCLGISFLSSHHYRTSAWMTSWYDSLIALLTSIWVRTCLLGQRAEADNWLTPWNTFSGQALILFSNDKLPTEIRFWKQKIQARQCRFIFMWVHWGQEIYCASTRPPHYLSLPKLSPVWPLIKPKWFPELWTEKSWNTWLIMCYVGLLWF